MSLILNATVCQSNGCNSLIFKELTGEYSVISNPEGWDDGSVNFDISTITEATLKIKKPGATAYIIKDLFVEGFPTTNKELEYEILSEDLGYSEGENIEDGKYEFVYTVSDGTTTFTKTLNILVYCNLSCCKNEMLARLANSSLECDDCNTAKLQKALNLVSVYNAVIYAARCGNVSIFTNLLEFANSLCEEENCGCN